jgi:hypothetical protein
MPVTAVVKSLRGDLDGKKTCYAEAALSVQRL